MSEVPNAPTDAPGGGDLIVKLVDKGDNLAGIGIRVDLPKGRTLTDAEKEIVRRHVKGEDGEQTGFSWNRDFGMWHKPIVRPGEDPRDVPSSRPIAIRPCGHEVGGSGNRRSSFTPR